MPSHETLFPKRRFGQNFLVDRNVVDRIIAAVNPQPDQTIIEIGPGRGALTSLLIEKAKSVVAIEFDRDLVAQLRAKFSASPKFELIEADALSIDFCAAIQPAGLGDGTFKVWEINIAVKDGLTALVDGPGAGTIAGSVITMREALRNITRTGVTLVDAVRMASAVPARVAGLGGNYGLLEAGSRADLIAFDDDFNVQVAR